MNTYKPPTALRDFLAELRAGTSGDADPELLALVAEARKRSDALRDGPETIEEWAARVSPSLADLDG